MKMLTIRSLTTAAASVLLLCSIGRCVVREPCPDPKRAMRNYIFEQDGFLDDLSSAKNLVQGIDFEDLKENSLKVFAETRSDLQTIHALQDKEPTAMAVMIFDTGKTDLMRQFGSHLSRLAEQMKKCPLMDGVFIDLHSFKIRLEKTETGDIEVWLGPSDGTVIIHEMSREPSRWRYGISSYRLKRHETVTSFWVDIPFTAILSKDDPYYSEVALYYSWTNSPMGQRPFFSLHCDEYLFPGRLIGKF